MGAKTRVGGIIAGAAGLLITAGVIVMVLLLMQGTKTEAEVVFTEGKMEITGQYGQTYKIEDISEVRMIDTLPAIGKKVNGAGLGEIRKGMFEVEGMGVCRLFLHAEGVPVLAVGTPEGYVLISYKDVEKTRGVYKMLVALTGYNVTRCDT